jgi:methionine-rich copper-binding protein CopC
MAPTYAFAHAAVVSSQPAANAQVAPGDLAIRLQFSSRVDGARARLMLIAPDRAQAAVTFSEASPGVLSAHARVEAPGRWTLRWQVLSVDGHVTRGDIPFTVGAGARLR